MRPRKFAVQVRKRQPLQVAKPLVQVKRPQFLHQTVRAKRTKKKRAKRVKPLLLKFGKPKVLPPIVVRLARTWWVVAVQRKKARARVFPHYGVAVAELVAAK